MFPLTTFLLTGSRWKVSPCVRSSSLFIVTISWSSYRLVVLRRLHVRSHACCTPFDKTIANAHDEHSPSRHPGIGHSPHLHRPWRACSMDLLVYTGSMPFPDVWLSDSVAVRTSRSVPWLHVDNHDNGDLRCPGSPTFRRIVHRGSSGCAYVRCSIGRVHDDRSMLDDVCYSQHTQTSLRPMFSSGRSTRRSPLWAKWTRWEIAPARDWSLTVRNR